MNVNLKINDRPVTVDAGSTILEACEEYCKGLGFSYIIAKTAEDSAQAFFNKNGYQPLRVFRDLRNEEDKKLFVAKCL